jgi:hypothetical protein
MYSPGDGSFGIANPYGLDGPRIESRLRRDIPRPSRPALGPIQPPVRWVTGLFPAGIAAGAWGWPPTLIESQGYRQCLLQSEIFLYVYRILGGDCGAAGKRQAVRWARTKMKIFLKITSFKGWMEDESLWQFWRWRGYRQSNLNDAICQCTVVFKSTAVRISNIRPTLSKLGYQKVCNTKWKTNKCIVVKGCNFPKSVFSKWAYLESGRYKTMR